MKKISKKIRYDFTIYTCLFLSLLLIGYSSYTYLDKQSYSLKEIFYETSESPIQEEPQKLKDINKIEIINKYLLNIADEIEKDNNITSEMLLDWNQYQVISTYYNRQIANDYYSYTTNIRVSNINTIYKNLENKELSTDKYIVVTINFNLLKNQITNEYKVKSTDITKNR